VSVDAHSDPTGWSARDTVGGLLASISIFASAVGVVWRPVRLLPFAIVLALVAARMSARQERLAALAVGISVVAWVLGMTIAIVTGNPLY
jgi:hypothetical protein